MFSQMIISEKLTRDTQRLASEREKQYRKSNHCWLDKKREMWFGPSNNVAPLEVLKFPLTSEHAWNHWSTDIIIVFMSQYWWGKVNKAPENDYLTCLTCPKYNPGKSVHANGFHSASPSHRYKYVWVMVCMFYHWVKLLWTSQCFCYWKTWSPLELHSDQGTHFTG